MVTSTQKHDQTALRLMPFDYVVLFSLQAISVIVCLWYGYTVYLEGTFEKFDIIMSLVVASLCGSQLSNARKLYKAAIAGTYSKCSSYLDIRRIGTFAFYLVRPLFAVFFALLTFMLWALTTDFAPLQEDITLRLVVITCLIGAFSGLYAGRLQEKFETKGSKMLGELMPNE